MVKMAVHSPMRRLPEDLLRSIFGIAVTTFTNKRDLTYPVPIQYVLGTVCRQWRDLILATPLLWVDIQIPVTAPYDTFSFFERSHPALINITFSTASSLASSELVLHSRLSKAIAAHMARIRSLKISVLNPQELPPIFQEWKELRCPNLEEVWLSIDAYVGAFGYTVPREDVYDPSWWTDGDALRSLRLMQLPFSKFPDFPNLTTLVFEELEAGREAFRRVLDKCARLETLVIRQLRDSERLGESADPTGRPIIVSSSLKTLALSISNHDALNCDCALTCLSLPNLENLEIGHFWTSADEHITSIFHNLSSSSHLKQLRIISNTIWHCDISFIFSLAKTTALEIIGFNSFESADKLNAILQATNLQSLVFDIGRGQRFSILEFLAFVTEKRPTLHCPLTLCYNPGDTQEVVAGVVAALATTLGDKFSFKLQSQKLLFLDMRQFEEDDGEEFAGMFDEGDWGDDEYPPLEEWDLDPSDIWEMGLGFENEMEYDLEAAVDNEEDEVEQDEYDPYDM